MFLSGIVDYGAKTSSKQVPAMQLLLAGASRNQVALVVPVDGATGTLTSLMEKVRANVEGAPEEESPSGSVKPTSRAFL